MGNEQHLMKRWVETWKTTGEKLDQIKTEELRRLTADRARAMSRTLLSFANNGRFAELRRETSGLVDQQRYFATWKR